MRQSPLFCAFWLALNCRYAKSQCATSTVWSGVCAPGITAGLPSTLASCDRVIDNTELLAEPADLRTSEATTSSSSVLNYPGLSFSTPAALETVRGGPSTTANAPTAVSTELAAVRNDSSSISNEFATISQAYTFLTTLDPRVPAGQSPSSTELTGSTVNASIIVAEITSSAAIESGTTSTPIDFASIVASNSLALVQTGIPSAAISGTVTASAAFGSAR